MTGAVNMRLLKRAGITALALGAGWFLLPVILGGTELAEVPVEYYLGRQLGAQADIHGMTVSTWHGSPEISIDSVELVDNVSTQFVAYSDSVRLRLSFWHLVIGRIKTTIGTAGRVDVELPTELLQRYLLSHGYLSRPLLEVHPAGLRQYLSLRDITFDLSSGAAWFVTAAGGSDAPFLRNTRFEFAGSVLPAAHRVTITRAAIRGTRVVEKRSRAGQSVSSIELAAPFSLEAAGVIEGCSADFPRIACTLDTLSLSASLRKGPGSLVIQLDAVSQSIDRVACIVPGMDWASVLSNLDLHVTSTLDPVSGRLATEASLSVDAGCLQFVPFTGGSLSAVLDNDRVTTFSILANTWGGFAHATLMDTGAEPGQAAASNRVLIGKVAVRDVNLNGCVGTFSPLPTRSDGSLNFDFMFDMENMGIAEFLRRELREFEFLNGQGSLSLSNACLEFFATEEWLESPSMPQVVRNVLGLAANLTGSAVTVPMLAKVIKEADFSMPRSVAIKLVVRNGVVTTPEVTAVTPLGTLEAHGQCDASGSLLYRIQLRLWPAYVAKYGDQPVIAMFRKGDILEFPVKITGSIGRPRVELDLTDQERDEFENRVMQVIENYVRKRLDATSGAKPDEDTVRKEMKRMEDMLRGMIRKLL